MTPLFNNLTAPANRPGESTLSDDDTELVGSRIGRLDPDNFSKPDEPIKTEDDKRIETEDDKHDD